MSVVIPSLNEEQTLEELHRRVVAAAGAWGDEWELILVDDGSTDGTWALIEALHRRDSHVCGLRLSRNFGHQAAVSAGLQHVRGEVAAVLEADLQDPPEELARFFAKWREGFEVIYAVRTQRKEGLLKRASYYLFYGLLSVLATVDIPLDSGDFCVMDRRVVDALNAMPERNRFVRGLRSWTGFKQVGLSYERS